MRFAIRFADKLVGLFVLVAIIGLLGVIIVLGANQRWFAKNYYFYTFFQSGKGISRGMPITFKGFEIGKVSSVEMNDKNEVVVHYYIYDTYYSKVKLNSVIELASSPLG
ncbi:MAG TPA: MCE family protein, partial [Spirochaetia bacterium]|nr:MCE family protein [Spirochaetia bacterium]